MRLLADAADLAGGRLVVTPWREVVVPGIGPDRVEDVERLVAAAGLVSDAASPWRRVTACVGRPSCARALADVRALASSTVASLEQLPDAPGHLHFAACERRCGRPSSAHREVVAGVDGCEVADVGPASSTAERERRPVAVLPAADVPAAAATSFRTRSSEGQ
jgi:precorrin-3B synthase